MAEKEYDLRTRTKEFALRVIRLYSSLPGTTVAQVIGKQMLRSGTSVGAQYREGVRSRSNAEFVSKLESSIQELEETIYWFELIVESEIFPPERMHDIIEEAHELLAILTSCVLKLKQKLTVKKRT